MRPNATNLRFRKRLLFGIALLILPIGFLWGCLYWVVGEEAVALTPWAYVAGSIISLAVFALRSRAWISKTSAEWILSNYYYATRTRPSTRASSIPCS